MTRFRNYLLAAVGFAILTGGLLVTGPSTSRAQAKAFDDVRVINTPAEAVPTAAQGTTAISGDVTVVNTPNVLVGNTAAAPVLARDVDNPARTPWQMSAQVTFASPSFQEVATFNPPIPAGKVFVIEFATAQANLPTGQRVRFILFTDVGYTLVQHYFAPTFVGTDFTVDNLVMSQPTRLYAIAAPTVNATRFADNADSGFVNFSLSGHLLNQ